MARVLVTGGVRSGKSRYAEALVDASAPAIYLTPGFPADPAADPEWAARVRAHQARRPAGWRTVETLDLATEISAAESPVLVDCLGVWVTRLLDSWQAWSADPSAWGNDFDTEVSRLVKAVARCPQVVLVTNEVGWGLVSEHRSGRLFADQLGRVNQAVAAACDQVVLLIAGRPLTLS
ncbi:bifunctional adenosylcobinamide kinase/adenosylcobinamide-phosphate guanylyltransferase [Micropruina sp.]|uniref:bifunctional adenosylcobinamide kinase/adenosylcobinamide-phosphate guanylyltransferase n=1 Tax=Micropruina sp. TaxID=2737536 RepID=UPI0039E4BCC7